MNKLDAAAQATTQVRTHVTNAADALHRDYEANAYGILMHPRHYAAALHTAIAELKDAAELIDKAQWPTDADYDAAERASAAAE